MEKDELKQLRRSLSMTQTEFGEWLAQQVNNSQDDKLKPVSAYTKQRIAEWENGSLIIPAKVEIVAMRRQLEQKDDIIRQLRQRRKQRQ